MTTTAVLPPPGSAVELAPERCIDLAEHVGPAVLGCYDFLAGQVFAPRRGESIESPAGTLRRQLLRSPEARYLTPNWVFWLDPWSSYGVYVMPRSLPLPRENQP
jgi:hypothetical protein